MQLMDTPEKKEKLVDAVHLFYKNVMEQKDLRHYFFGMTVDKLIISIELFEDFVMPKPDRITVNLFHKQPPQPYISKLLSLTSCK